VNAITDVPWHVYLTMLVFAVTIGLLAAFEVRDLRSGRAAPARRERRRDLRPYPQRGRRLTI